MTVAMGRWPTNSDENQVVGRAILPAAGFSGGQSRLKAKGPRGAGPYWRGTWFVGVVYSKLIGAQ